MKKIIAICHFIFFLAIVFSAVQVSAQPLKGKYHFIADSDGKKANAKAIITIQFADNTFKLKAEQPGSLVEDQGTYQISGNTISISFKEMEQGKKKGTFSIANGVLTLPFKMLDNLSGTSQWQLAGTITANTTTKDQVIEQAITGAQKKSKWSTVLDNRATAGITANIDKAAAYYNQATLFYFKGFKWEALYGYAKAAQLQNSNGLYLNNFSSLLLELGRIYDAKVLLEEITKQFPNLASPWANLAYLYHKLDATDEAKKAIYIAMRLAPDNGMYCYTAAKIEEEKGNKAEAERLIQQAWDLGYAGEGREGAKNASKKAAKQQNPSDKNVTPVKNNPNKPPNKNTGPQEKKQAIWAGNYQAKYVRARSGETAAEANTTFGKDLASTTLNLQTLACAKNFSMNISSSGFISGSGSIMYVYQGTSASPVMGMAPAVLTAASGGFAANLKDGYQIRDWSFTGTVDEEGNVEINGMPTEQMDLLNVGKWQKIKPWSALPPDAAGAAMKGPFHMKLQMDKDKNPFIRIDQSLDLGDKLIKRVHYESFIVKSDNEIKPDCQFTAPAPATCPASEFIKTKVSMSPKDHITLEASTTYTKGDNGGVQKQQDMACNVSGDWSMGLATTSVEFHQDNSYEFTVGIGVDAKSFIKGSPVSLKEKLELIYDSKCGWGVKASAAAEADGPIGTKAGASVEGVIFFNKGL
ncbi:MAG: tetratricopeptide repeat protein [Ferruginibacter sp.]